MSDVVHNKMPFNRLYIHVPFCASKCAYCAFYSETTVSDTLLDDYFRRLEEEFAENVESCRDLKSIFIGGGTPNSLSPANLAKLFNLISANFPISPDAEISMECNPESMDAEKVDIIAKFANRVSLGVQTFNPAFRKTLGRQGTPENVFNSISMLKNAGVSNLGCDLMYSIPGQTLKDLKNDLDSLMELEVKHISAYSLTYEEGTFLSAKYADQIDHEAAAELEAVMWQEIGTRLSNVDILRYEVSNYARRGFECSHNMDIWYGDSYLGCGPAATSFDGVDRYTNPADIAEWLAATPPERDTVSKRKRAAEILIMGLRTSRGWDPAKFAERTGCKLSLFEDKMTPFVNDGLMIYTDTLVKLTEEGLLLWDTVAEAML